MGLIIQYIIIFVLFVIALYVIFKPFFSKKPKSGCGKGCCSVDMTAKQQ